MVSLQRKGREEEEWRRRRITLNTSGPKLIIQKPNLFASSDKYRSLRFRDNPWRARRKIEYTTPWHETDALLLLTRVGKSPTLFCVVEGCALSTIQLYIYKMLDRNRGRRVFNIKEIPFTLNNLVSGRKWVFDQWFVRLSFLDPLVRTFV